MVTPFIQTYAGGHFTYEADSYISRTDVFHHLSHVCRYAGACKFHYSVLQHSMLVVEILKSWGHGPEIQKHGLLHDAHEAFMGDFPTPFQVWLSKRCGRDVLEEAKDHLDDIVMPKLGVQWPVSDVQRAIITKADKTAFVTEVPQVMTTYGPWLHQYMDRYGVEPFDVNIEPMVPLEVKTKAYQVAEGLDEQIDFIKNEIRYNNLEAAAG